MHGVPVAPPVLPGPLRFRVEDPDGRLAAVRLCCDLQLSDAERSFVHEDGAWVLRLPLPPLSRLEYELELQHPDGNREYVCDPANPLRAEGPFGARSELLLPGYQPPWWLDAPPAAPSTESLALYSPTLLCAVRIEVWSPPMSERETALPLLIANDGPEYARLAGLISFAAAIIARGHVGPFRLALLAPGHRDAWYSANPAYAKALATEVLPQLRRRLKVSGRPVAMGASLGALAMLHAQRRHRGTFGGLFLQSGSFFTPALDPQEAGFPYFGRIIRYVRAVQEATVHREPVPAVLTCGRGEENLANNRALAAALTRQGYAGTLHEVGDTHNFTAWRDALHPHLTDLLARVWAR